MPLESEIYQDFILELYKNPINFGKIADADLYAEGFNPLCGDKIDIYIKVEGNGHNADGKILEAKFIGTGCAISQASACLLTEEIKGKTLNDISKMQKESIMKIIKIDLSKNPSRLKCALLSLEVLKRAIVRRG